MATVGPTNIPAFFNADSDFRTWGSTISAALSTLGLVAASDTGQINWTTVSKPSAGSTVQGYEVWKFNDSLQGTTPVYIKVEYGSSSAADRPSLWITVGSGSNGSGTLTGQLSTRQQIAPSASKTAGVQLPMYASGNSGEIQLAVNIDTGGSTFGMLFTVERTKDSTDTATSEGVLYSGASANFGVTSQYVPGTGTVPASSSNWCGMPPNLWSRSASGANVDVNPIFIPLGGVWRYSHLAFAKAGDLASGGSWTATIFGASHTYMSFDNAFGTIQPFASSVGISMRWE